MVELYCKSCSSLFDMDISKWDIACPECEQPTLVESRSQKDQQKIIVVLEKIYIDLNRAQELISACKERLAALNKKELAEKPEKTDTGGNLIN